MSDIRLVLSAPQRHAVEEVDCEECGARAGTSCMRSGGAVVGGSRQMFGEYAHESRVESWRAKQ